VRPIIKDTVVNDARDPKQTEWTIAEGISDLADCRAAAFINADWGAVSVSLLFG
jgi:hypothetical protein